MEQLQTKTLLLQGQNWKTVVELKDLKMGFNSGNPNTDGSYMYYTMPGSYMVQAVNGYDFPRTTVNITDGQMTSQALDM
jgi:hypothetical protein